MASKGGKALDRSMMDALRDLNNKAADKVATGIDKVFTSVNKTAEAAVDKTKQMKKDAGEVTDSFKKVDLKRPLD
jgi:hypothetical protein